MNKGGRPKDCIWQFFAEITLGNKKLAECKTCQTKITSRTDRLKAHFARCKPENDEMLRGKDELDY